MLKLMTSGYDKTPEIAPVKKQIGLQSIQTKQFPGKSLPALIRCSLQAEGQNSEISDDDITITSFIKITTWHVLSL